MFRPASEAPLAHRFRTASGRARPGDAAVGPELPSPSLSPSRVGASSSLSRTRARRRSTCRAAEDPAAVETPIVRARSRSLCRPDRSRSSCRSSIRRRSRRRSRRPSPRRVIEVVGCRPTLSRRPSSRRLRAENDAGARASPARREPVIERNEDAHVSLAFHPAPPTPPARGRRLPEPSRARGRAGARARAGARGRAARVPAATAATRSRCRRSPRRARLAIVLNLVGDEELDVAFFATEAEANAAARELVAGIAKDAEWPQVGRKFIPPERITSVEVRERARFRRQRRPRRLGRASPSLDGTISTTRPSCASGTPSAGRELGRTVREQERPARRRRRPPRPRRDARAARPRGRARSSVASQRKRSAPSASVGQLAARRRVARVGEQRAVRRATRKPYASRSKCRHAARLDLEPGRLERRAVLVLVQRRTPRSNIPGFPQSRAKLRELLRAARREPELRRRVDRGRAVRRARPRARGRPSGRGGSG